MKTLRVLILLSTISFYGLSQGSGKTLQFDDVNDYVDLGNIYDDLNFPFSISAWIYLDGSGNDGGPVFASQDNSDLYNGFWFYVTPTIVYLEYGDGMGSNSPSYRRGRSATISSVIGRWTHVTAVASGPDNITLYVNGINVGGEITGLSSNTMSSNYPGDHAKIGSFFSNGVNYLFKGQIDDLRVYNKALSVTDVRKDMCRSIASSTDGLIGYWSFDESSGNTLTDKSTRNFNGTLFGGPQRVYSGAPIGNSSVYRYEGSWTGKSLTMDLLTASNVSGLPEGLHLYKVEATPSQVGGLSSPLPEVYYGVFLASQTPGKGFDLSYGAHSCDAFTRLDNSRPEWLRASSLSGIINRTEISAITVADFAVDLGDNKTICDETNFIIDSGIDELTGRTFSWNTGQTTPGITVNQSGDYILTVSESCVELKDTINISFLKTPPAFSLGDDEVVCSVPTREFKAYDDPTGYNFEWQDGSTNPTFVTTTFGSYWVKVYNVCGTASDAVEIIDRHDPTFNLDLGEDKVLCDENVWPIFSGVENKFGRTFVWNTNEVTPDVTVGKSGDYILTVTDACEELKDTINVSFKTLPPPFSLGDDEKICSDEARHLAVYDDPSGYQFTWQDGSTDPQYEVKGFGTYWVEVKNECGVAQDSVVFTSQVTEMRIPNVITPNGDGYNEFFIIEPLTEGCSLSIYNRWGKEVFFSTNYSNNWNAVTLSAGVYFYLLSDECVGEKRGVINVLK